MQKSEIEAHSWHRRKSREASDWSRGQEEDQEVGPGWKADQVGLAGFNKDLALLFVMWEAIVGL